jgi:hypothetical protein
MWGRRNENGATLFPLDMRRCRAFSLYRLTGNAAEKAPQPLNVKSSRWVWSSKSAAGPQPLQKFVTYVARKLSSIRHRRHSHRRAHRVICQVA